MMLVIVIAKVRLATLLHSWFQILLSFSSRLKIFHSQFTFHTSSLLSTQLKFLLIMSGIMWLNTALWWVRTPQCGRQTALWPCPRSFPSVQNGVWPH